MLRGIKFFNPYRLDKSKVIHRYKGYEMKVMDESDTDDWIKHFLKKVQDEPFLGIFKKVDESCLREVVSLGTEVVGDENQDNPYFLLVGFYDSQGLLMGGTIFCISPVWYNYKIVSCIEMATFNSEHGHGTLRFTAEFLEYLLKNNIVDVVISGDANPVYATTIQNVYNKYGFSAHHTFYKTK